jgi:hypothetical protein
LGFIQFVNDDARNHECEDYRVDVCRITKGGHIEHMWVKKTWGVFLSIDVRITMLPIF